MQEKPKKEEFESAESSCREKDKDLWESDQKEHEYYYDDAHGYEIYENEDEVDDENGDQS